ncbi:UNVERIFIED_CONTAM: hypothetical protein Sangu_0191700 [Sesamum angustifolium]|uniref:PORR domain-containing protein n=1 Tax=Sesamum angustifolium TaxID=2727405 RepID=A0AAW2RME1_9LAMI
MEKRAVGIVHEVLSLTVEKMVEGCFIFQPKERGTQCFLREAYERGCLIESNLVYEARRKLLDLVLLSCRGLGRGDHKSNSVDQSEENEVEEMYND